MKRMVLLIPWCLKSDDVLPPNYGSQLSYYNLHLLIHDLMAPLTKPEARECRTP